MVMLLCLTLCADAAKLDAVKAVAVKLRAEQIAYYDDLLAKLAVNKKTIEKRSVDTRAQKPVNGQPLKVFTSKAEKQKALESIEKSIADTEDARNAVLASKYVWPDMEPDSLKVGMLGRLGNERGPYAFEIQTVVDKSNAIVKTGNSYLWLEIPTTGMVDGKRFTFNGLMEVTGTRTYKTVIGGSKTIFVLRIVDVD